jgi:hypothetical protein
MLAYFKRLDEEEKEKEDSYDSFSRSIQKQEEKIIMKEEEKGDKEKDFYKIPEFDTPEEEKDTKLYPGP